MDFKRARHADPGKAFQQFVGEFFVRDHPQLKNFLAGGKDGAIDCHDEQHGIVWESKYITEDGIEAARARWQEVAKHLRDNLLDHQPINGQGQYRPWYETGLPICTYHFCVSSRLSNLNQHNELTQDIKTVFAELSQRQGLAHLANIQVTVWSLASFEPALSTCPGLRLRWFGAALPVGVRQLEDGGRHSAYPGFRAYLHGTDKIRYVSLGGDLAPESIAASLKGRGETASVLIGRGGSGKSRLLLEAGRAAEKQDWAVFTLDARRADPNYLDVLLSEVGDAPTLLLMDYMERCTRWDEWLAALEDKRNDGLTVHVLGSCRDSWKSRLDQSRIRLIPLATEQEGTVTGILAQRPGLADYRAQCKNVPVFAAFLCLLYDKSQQDGDSAASLALKELCGQTEFETWLQQHVAELPEGGSDPDALTTLLIQLPCSQQSLLTMEQEQPTIRKYRERLVDDGWILMDSDAEADEAWAALHDVLADGAMTAWARRHLPYNTQLQMEQWLAQAKRIGTLPALLRCLQRNALDENIAALPWSRLFNPQSAEIWQNWRDDILRTHLMQPLDAFVWLTELEGAPATLTGPVLAAVSEAIAEARYNFDIVDTVALQTWADAVAQALTRSGQRTLPRNTYNRVLKNALLWKPDRYAAAAARWLDCEAGQEQAQFLLNAWNSLPPEVCPRGRVLTWLRYWLENRPTHLLASFVFSGYLDSKQSPLAIQDQVKTWLEAHRTDTEAQFVYDAWLDAGGDLALVRDPIAEWLAQHRTDAEAQFVFNAWLDAGGELALVRDPIAEWLAQHRTDLVASHVFKAWLDAGGDLALVRDPIAEWLAQHRSDAEAQFVFKAWLDVGGDLALVRDPIAEWLAQHRTDAEASHVFQAWLNAGGDLALVRDPIAEWLAQHRSDLVASHVFKAWLVAGGELRVIETEVRAWFEDGNNAHSEGAGFLIRALGDCDPHLPEWILPHARAWVRQYRLSPDAVYPIKYVARHPELDTDTAQAILEWCGHFSNDDAVYRLARLHQHFAEMPDRTALIRIGLKVVEDGLNRNGNRPGLGEFWLQSLSIVGLLFALPGRTPEEQAVWNQNSGIACDAIRQWAQTEIPGTDNLSLLWLMPVASANWELMVILGGGTAWDEPLRLGVRRWANWCMQFAQYEDQITALRRLLVRAEEPGRLG